MSETNVGSIPPEFYTEPSSAPSSAPSVPSGPPGPPGPPPHDDMSTETDTKTETDTHTTKTDGSDCPSYPSCPPDPKPPKSKPVFVPVTVEVAPIVELFVNEPKICLQNKAKSKPCFFFVSEDESDHEEVA
jgi:hypothetical protein